MNPECGAVSLQPVPGSEAALVGEANAPNFFSAFGLSSSGNIRGPIFELGEGGRPERIVADVITPDSARAFSKSLRFAVLEYAAAQSGEIRDRQAEYEDADSAAHLGMKRGSSAVILKPEKLIIAAPGWTASEFSFNPRQMSFVAKFTYAGGVGGKGRIGNLEIPNGAVPSIWISSDQFDVADDEVGRTVDWDINCMFEWRWKGVGVLTQGILFDSDDKIRRHGDVNFDAIDAARFLGLEMDEDDDPETAFSRIAVLFERSGIFVVNEDAAKNTYTNDNGAIDLPTLVYRPRDGIGTEEFSATIFLIPGNGAELDILDIMIRNPPFSGQLREWDALGAQIFRWAI